MVTDDPEGVTHWKVTHGIRLSGMPGFGSTLSDTQRWQLTMLVAHAGKLSPAVEAGVNDLRSFESDGAAGPSVTHGSGCWGQA